MLHNIKIYRIDQELYKFDNINSKAKKIEFIIKHVLTKYKSKKKFKFKDLPNYEIDGIKYYLFVHNFKDKKSDWNTFFPLELSATIKFDITNLSLLLFIDNGIDIFLVVGGKGYQSIIPFLDHSFGLTVMSKLINPNEDLIISINSRGLTGSRSGVSEQFRNEFRMIDFIRFGKVPTEIHLVLSLEMSKEFFSHLQNKSSERVKIYAGKPFKVKKNLDFDLLHKTVLELGFILERESNNYLSTYIEVRDNNLKRENLWPLLMNALYNELGYIGKSNNSKDLRFKFDLCHPDKMVQFYEADHYLLKEKTGEREYTEFGRVEDRNKIYEAVMKRALEEVGNSDFFEFRAYIQGVRVVSYSDGKLSSSASFVYHFTSEFTFNNQAVFLVDTKWYILNNSFIDDLKYECVQSIKNHRLPNNILKLPWDKSKISKESEYNLLYQKKKNYIVLDTFTPQGIELCDVLYLAKDTVYLIHVKFGFDSSMRELSNQITLSARRLQEDTKSGKFEYIDKIFEQAKHRINYKKKEFRSKFTGKVVYVFAFASQLKNDDLVVRNIEKYKSNIARYSLVQCNKDMQSFNYELNIKQIRRN